MSERSPRERRQSMSFGAVADLYERARPGYPAEALRWLVPEAARRVLDLGAGTGLASRGLLALGVELVAVEPSEGMREQFRRAVPGVEILDGSAESIPLPDGSVDAVVVAQAWHWVDTDRAVPEVARVLAPGGQLGLVWNIRDETVPWVRELGRIVEPPRGPDHDGESPVVGEPFSPVERHDVSWSQRLDVDGLVDLVASRSYAITMEPAERERMLAEVRRLAVTHPDLAGSDVIELPYVTRCSRARLG